MAHDVFISHSSKDKITADAICHALEQNRISCWIAPRDVRGGHTYGAEIIEAIEECAVLVLLFSENSNNSEDVKNEIQNAFASKKIIIPYRMDDSEMDNEMKYFLSRKHWIEAYPDDTVFAELVNSVKNTLGISKTSENNKNPQITSTPEQEQVLYNTSQPIQIKEKKTVTPVSVATNNQNLYGNTAGNIYNGGNAAIQGDWIYFCSSGNKLYKIKTDDSEYTLLADDINSSTGFINVVGDWIYYQYHRGKDWAIYRIKTDGTGNEKLADGSGGNIFVVGDSLFYLTDNSNLAKLDLQTMRRKTFKIAYVASFGIFKDKILGHIAENKSLIMDLDGNNMEELNFGNSFGKSCISEYDGFYYYVDIIYTTQRFIMKRPINGGNPIKLAEGFSFNIVNGWIYFDNSQDNHGLYKMKLDGNEKTKLANGLCACISIVGDWIYYQDYLSFYRIKTDGTEEENLNDVIFSLENAS